MRAFLGYFPNEEFKTAFKDLKQQLRKQKQNLRFVPAPDIHLTLKFLGADLFENTTDYVKDDVWNVVREHAPFDITISNVRFGFEKDRNPRVLNVSIVESEKLNNLVSDIETIVSRGKYPDLYPPRDFRPHFTLARIHGNYHQKKVREIQEALAAANWTGAGITMKFNSFKLIESEQGKDGMVYRTLEEFTL